MTTAEARVLERPQGKRGRGIGYQPDGKLIATANGTDNAVEK
jgi:hypothetical protein